ncbi:hypothetical protein F5876DRAFT_61552 [Lentinula aff. lateritia]|uniref:Uncharacterized protein n=1 Tax=Lentinula aff. lateritia TaxID=2804960 RepID=A0ACC1UEZ4_9AGAR|nr:hypothetical protein F5876DRAFT_61552 [Lentinula aff. lateritia]
MSMRSIAHGYNSVLYANFRRRTTTAAFIAMRFNGPSRYCELALTGLLAILVFRARSQDPDMKRCNIVRGDGKGRGVFNLFHYRDSQACTFQYPYRYRNLVPSATLRFALLGEKIAWWWSSLPDTHRYDINCLMQTPAPSVYAFQA